VLATADFDLLGLAVTVDPPSLTVPKNTPTSIHTSISVPEGSDPTPLIAALNPNYRVRGELTGPSLTGPLTLEALVGQPLNIPSLSNAGDHLIRNLRVVDISTPDQAVVTSVTPDAVGIVVIERLLVSQVQVQELTYDQILQAGINITDDSYRAFNFTLGIGTSSSAETISIPVAFPTVGIDDSRPVIGTPSVSSPGIDVPTVYPIMLTPEGADGDPSGTPQGAGEALPKIPGVIVFPGRVGLLHQFFEAIVIVGNGAPNGSPLVLHSLRAKAKLPDSGTPADASDDPLRIADTQTGGRVSELELHGLGPDGKYGTGDDTTTFGPGGSGQATFLLEGLKEGLHPISFDLEAMLEGLPSGPVKVKGEVPGAVLVRDASFAVTFTHPNVVRASNEYDLGMTIYNSGQTNINGAFAQLAPNSISGAELVNQDTGRRDFAATIKRGESATVKWHLRANVTGAVTASYVKVGEGVSAGLALVTGVGDRNIPLSPDSLILPEPVRHLPPPVVEAGRALLGQAWSIANAPPGSLPQGVMEMKKQVVVDRAVELGIAGMRVDFGEADGVSLDTTLRDWLGELQAVPDPGFADTQRDTRSGYEWFDSIGAEYYKRLNAGSSSILPVALHQEFANTELPRSPFISALVTQAPGQEIVGARFLEGNHQVGFGPAEGERNGDLAQGSSLRISQTDVITGAVTDGGQMLVVSNPAAEFWTLELNGWRTGTVDLSLVAPSTSQTYKLFAWGGVAITQGGKYRVRFKPLELGGTLVLEEYRDGSWQAMNETTTVTTLNQPAPQVVGVIQVTPSVVAGGDKYGRLVGVLFSKPMLKAAAQTATRYTIAGGNLKGSNPPQLVGDPISVKAARLDYGDRFVFMSLDSTIGPYIDRDLNIASMVDTRGLTLAATTRAIETRVSPHGVPPGAYLTGRVLNADGTPVVNAPVIVWVQDCPDPTAILPPEPTPIVLKRTNAQGRYAIDYVRDGDCGPINVSVTNPTTLSSKRLTSPVAYDGQHMVLDMVFLARGTVQGTVTMAGQPMPRAFVRVVPDLDVVGTKVVQTDASGHYIAEDVPVGNVSVLAVGADAAHNASGFNAGTIPGPGQSAFVNVSLQNISGAVRGHVVHGDQSPAPGALVVAYEVIAGFHSLRGDGATAVGYAFADRDGSFAITNLPVGDVKLEVTDYVTGLITQQNVQLTTAIPEVNGLLVTLPGTGSVSGRVTDDTGTPLPGVFVSSSGRGVQTDFLGNYTLQSLPAGQKTITAYDQETQRSGTAAANVTIGQTTSGINIVILRPSTLRGTVYVVNEGTSTPVPAAGVQVSADGFRIVTTNAQGQYTITGVQSGDLLMRFVDTGKGYAVNTPVKLLPGETLTKDATFRPGTIHGKVFQPDGVTPTIAELSVYVSRPEPTIGFGWGLLSTDPPLSTQSAADGSYSLNGVNPGTYRITTSNVFFPTRVSAGGTLPPSGNVETDLVLVSTLAGKIQGNVYQPDGTTLVGPGIRVTLSGGSLADATVRTDANGHYEFAEVFSAGAYQLTATDPVTGNLNRIGVSVERNKDAVFDLRLLGSGNLRVQVLDGAGQPVTGGAVTVDGTDYPNAHRFAEVPVDSNGQVSFNNLPEGSYAISATRFGLGGRVSARVTMAALVDVSVQLQATGNVEGHVFLPDGTTAISLADVQLSVGGRSVGFTTTSEDPDTGKFSFINVPTGDFTLDAFDNHTGRVGRAAGSITTQGETVVVNVLLLPIGAVAGQVTANGAGVDHASVRITADGSGVRGANLFATTDPTGHYRFTGIPAGRFVVSVSDAPGGQTGSASGTISGTVEPLPDTICNIALEPSQTVNGTVFKHGGVDRVPGAEVTITIGGRVFHTSTNDQGNYSLSFVPLGQVYVRAEAPVGYDRGDTAPVSGTQAGATVTINVTLAGTGAVSGQALDNNGAPLSAGTVTFTNDAWSPPIVLNASVQSDGSYEIPGAPAGHFSLRLTVPGRVGVGSATGEVLAGQTTNVPLQLENAGAVAGRVNGFDGTTTVQGASVSVTLFRSSGSLTFYTHTNAQGNWTLNNIPLGTLDILVNDEVSGGVARLRGVALATNGQTVDVGTMRLDNTPISVVSVEPANGALGIPTNGAVIRVTFSEPAETSTVNGGTVQLQQGVFGIGTTLTLSNDGLVATLTPTNRLVEGVVYSVVVNQVEDRAGLRIANAFNSTFTTADETAPVVSTIVPANNSSEFALDGTVTVTFNEPLDPNLSLATVLYVASLDSPQSPLTGTYALDATGRIVTFTPAGGFAESTRYTITVNGQRDLSGNTQTQAVASGFAADDQTAPVVDPLTIDGTSVQNLRPTITATYHDNLAGIKTSTVVLLVDGINVTSSASVNSAQLSYTPATSLALGQHTAIVQVSDNGGNTSLPRNATFTIVDTTPPTVTSITPVNNAVEIDTGATVAVTFSEPLDTAAGLADVIKVTGNQSPGVPLAGAYSFDASGSVVTFQPAGGFNDSTQFTITVNGERDPSGNVQTQPFVSTFATKDLTAPIIDPLPIDGTTVRVFRPTIIATYHDSPSGIKTSTLVLKVDNVNVTQNAIVTGTQVTYTPATPLSGGRHNVTVQVADNVGNVSALRSASFDIDDSGPAISSFTIGGAPAVDGMYVTSSLQPIFVVNYTDDTGVNVAASRLLFAPQGSPLVQVPATITQTSLTYQPPMLLAEGQYAVQAILTNNLGTSSTTGIINFTLDVDAPEIASVTPATGSQHGGTTVTLTGARLLSSTGAAPTVTIGGFSAVVTSAVAGSPDTVTLITPAGAPGPATIRMDTNKGTGVRVGGFTYQSDPRTPFITEPDSILLWHMDEPGNGVVRLLDSGITRTIFGNANGTSVLQPGRFAFGRSSANIASDFSSSLAFGSNSFTVEGWVKTDPVGRTYSLFGKEEPSGGQNFVPEWGVRLAPSGNLHAFANDSSFRLWATDLSASTYRIDDGQWHYIAMVLNRTVPARLSIYVDGVERAFSAPPASFGPITSSGQSFRVGHWAQFDPQTTGGPEAFPGTVDEVRVSTTAHSSDQIQKTYLGTEGTLGITITNSSPLNLGRGTTTDVLLNGYNLAGTSATVTGLLPGQATAQVTASAATQARVQVTISADAQLGNAQLVISSSAGSASLGLRIVELSQISLAVEPDTRLLWHMDETANGATTIFDEGLLKINGTSGNLSLAQPGRFAGARSRADISTVTGNTYLYFGNSSFTAEGWMKTDNVGRTYTIFGKEDSFGGQNFTPEWAVRLLPSGTLRAFAYDNNFRLWQIDVPVTQYRVDDNQWHYVAMVVDRAANRMSLYIDGSERAGSASPTGFNLLTNSGQAFRVGHWAAFDPQTTGGPQEFPGVVDEVRVSASAHTAARILDDMTGTSPLRIVSYDPKEVLREKAGLPSTITRIVLNGYNLDGVSVRLMRDGQDVPAVVSVVSSSPRQVSIDVDALANAPLGTAQLVFSKPGQADAAVDLRISEQTQFAGALDTLLLWNLNETGDGAVKVLDAGALGINGNASALSLAQPGRYGGGRSKANIFSDPDKDALYLGTNSFTAECWFKTGPVTRSYSLVAKEDSFGGQNFTPEFSLRLVPGGTLRGYAYDQQFRQWKAEMDPLVYRVDDNQWHHIALVADRVAQRMSIYVDGVERAFGAMPAGFSALTKSGQPVRAGHWAVFEGGNVGNEEFPGVIDDVRLSNTAHSAERIRADLDGVPGLRVNSYGPKEIPRNQPGGPVQFTTVTASGYGLDGVTATVVRDGLPLDATVIVDSSSFYQAQVRVSAAETVAPGYAQLVFAKPGLSSVPVDIRISQQSEFAVDNDTRLLWHLNETANGSVHVADAGPLSLGGTSDALSIAEPAGHFGYGRSKADIFSDPDSDALYLGTSSFTAECWFKTNPVTRSYSLVAKEDSFGGQNFTPEFTLRLTPSGALRAYAYDQQFRQWKAEMLGRVYDPATGRWKPIVDDNEWHHVAMVADRDAQRMSLYVDGVERAFSPMPANFGALIKSGQPVRAGHWAVFEEGNIGNEEFPGTIDEVRISHVAHSAARVLADAMSSAGPSLRVNSYGPKEIPRNQPGGPVQFTTFTATGNGLDGVTATVVRDGLPLDATVIIDSSSFYQAQLRVSVASTVVPGFAQLVFAKPGLPTAPVDIRISQQSEFATDTDTRLLWHLNETANGSVHVADAGPLGIGGTTDALSVAEPAGHFGYARSKADIFSDADFDALYLGANSFTAECWFKTNPVTRSYSLLAKEDSFGGQNFTPEFSLRLVPGGTLRAYAYDQQFRQWKAEMLGRVYDPTTGRWKPMVEDNEWHHVAMVVDRDAQRMSIYVDGVERAFGAMPANFGALIKSGQAVRVGHWAVFEGGNVGNEEFPGTIDEVRISTTAHSAARVLADALGTDTERVALVQPSYVATGSFAVPVKFTGNGLAGATVTTDQANVPITVTSTSQTEINCLLDVPSTAAIGQLHFNVATTGGQNFVSQLTIVAHQPFDNAANSGTETSLLWHLDETANGAVHINGSGDAVPAVIGGTAGSASTAADGRFAKGRVKANIVADTSTALAPGTSSFTIECWLKSTQLTRSYTLVGKEDSFGGQNFTPEYTLRLLSSGGLRAYIYDTQFRQWRADMAGKVFDSATNRYLPTLNDGLWHYVAMVADRTSGRLVLYVDGAERASGSIPANFGAVYNTTNPLRVGHWAFFEEGSSGPEEFPGTIDEVRMQNFARSAAQIADTWYGTNNAAGSAPQAASNGAPSIQPTPVIAPPQPQILATSVTPNLVVRNKGIETPQVTNVMIAGSNLKGVSALATRDGEPLKGIVATVTEASDAGLQVALAVAPSTPLGPAQLVLSKRGYQEAAAEIRVIEPSEFALETDTVGLWHLNEGAETGAHLIDNGERAINLTSEQASRVVAGRFGAARTLARATADANNDALSFSATSFTVEGWVKTPALERDTVLVAKETSEGQNTDFRLKALSSGALRVELFDTSGLSWQAETLPGTVNIADNQWHAVTFVVDRELGLLSVYVDGVVRVVAPAPAEFTALRNLGQPLIFGGLDSIRTASSTELAGAIDELRISATAHNPEKISTDFFGHDEPQVTLVRPVAIRKGKGPIEVTLSGYGFQGSTVKANQPGVSVAVGSVTSTTIKLSLSLSESVGNEPIELTITDALGRTTSAAVKSVDGVTGSRLGNSGNESRSSNLPASRNRSKRATSVSSRTSRASQDATPVGGQR
jgi:hypothetical protein